MARDLDPFVKDLRLAGSLGAYMVWAIATFFIVLLIGTAIAWQLHLERTIHISRSMGTVFTWSLIAAVFLPILKGFRDGWRRERLDERHRNEE